jgi:hypothetical protein
MNPKIKTYIIEILKTFFLKVLIYDLILFALIGVSFLFIGEFSAIALSERMFWVGIVTMLLGGFLVWGQTSGGRDFGTPVVTAAQAQLLTDFNIEVRQDVNKKFSPFIRVFLIGTICLLCGILVQVIWG